MLDPQLTLNCGGQLLTLNQPRVMGILNITPDSFYAGSRMASVKEALNRASEMLMAGADILDIGGMSSRPGADLISSKEERQRVIPVIKAIKDAHPDCIISIDTVYAETARTAVAAGAGLINDISAGSIDPDLWEALPEFKVPYVLMHMRGTPKDMQKKLDYKNVVTEIWDHLAEKHTELTQSGVNDIIIDPGFGFGKSVEQNYALLNNLHAFRTFNRPVLAGISRKSMIWRPLGISPATALNGTTALHVIALQQGASILRVHDVREAVDVVRLMELVDGQN
ncbi:MAG: dihydropteroate synthase [Bacteroidota bacterium]